MLDYFLKQGAENTVAIWIKPEFRDRGESEAVILGNIDINDEFYGNEDYPPDMVDIRIIVKVAGELKEKGFQNVFDSL